ncbi:hypothetical protein D9757_001198 [Collybiopsis confluens]|uniref:Uncharacterized protein n=1 Tax=Collybiopsis confluens TaxID=2823264 RepID=A0A8H5MGS6_9AGAR|nr:hypothetical protein D9757_001198 [Collybiopsis confluens]
MDPSTGFSHPRGKTPPPAYTPPSLAAGPSASTHLLGGAINPGSGSDPYNPYTNVNYNPWANVPTSLHPGPLSNSGPTPASALQIPYAYYDPRSAHSIAEADARAKARFWLTLFWVVGTWFMILMLCNWIQLEHSEWIEYVAEMWHRWVKHGWL